MNRSAAGTVVPAGTETPRPGERTLPTAHERTLMRRRLRLLRRRRADLAGGNGHSHELQELDAETQALKGALADLSRLDELISSGGYGRCPSCGDLTASRDRHCLHCGAQLPQAHGGGHNGADRVQQRQPARAPQPTAAATGASSGRSQTPPAR